MWLVKSMILLISIENIVSAQDGYYALSEKRNGYYCGKNLAEVLRMVCDGFYNTFFPKKADPDFNMVDWTERDWEAEMEAEAEYPFRSRSVVEALIPHSPRAAFRRRIRGVHDECCRKPCTYDELSSYCADKKQG